MHLRRPPSIALLGALLGVLSPSGAHADGERHRWPRWPTEFDQVVAPLRDEAAPGRDHDRVEALLRLDAYATDLVAPWLLLALGDPSSAVKREALRLCFEREVVACVPSALAIGSAVTEPMLRVAALRVVGLDPSGAGLDALLGALRDEGESMRAQAAAVLGSAALHGSGRSRATAALLAKLGDLSAVVRQSAVEALGTIGSTDATLPIARLLEDAEPAVRLAAARSLGQIGDPRGVAALVRSLEAANEPAVVRAIVAALAILPGEAAGAVLLAAFDEPPAGLTGSDVADLLGLRPAPEPVVLDGLAVRLRDPSSARLALRTLGILGASGRGVLERELARGLSPELALDVERVLAGRRVPVGAARARDPEIPAAPQAPVDGLEPRRAATPAQALADVDRLAASRDWGPILDAELLRGGAVEDRRVELALAIAEGPRAALGRWDRRSVATLVGWARDPGLAAGDRCLALLALASVDRRAPGAKAARRVGADAMADPDPRVRACAVAPARALGDRHDRRALLDPDPRVRVVAVLLAQGGRPTRAERAEVDRLAATDDDAHVRAAARRRPPAPRDAEGRVWLHGGGLDPSGRWMRARVGGTRLWLPTIRVAGVAFAWSPIPGATADPDE
ncbi:MAG: HEAT repeat domain-containing protein [Myxococcales bacterium]|nr:HEAT repeat domain-containing protein [Myxococcales bacterium]